MSLTDEQIEQGQKYLSAWRSLTCKPMASHVVVSDFAICEWNREEWCPVGEHRIDAAKESS